MIFIKLCTEKNIFVLNLMNDIVLWYTVVGGSIWTLNK